MMKVANALAGCAAVLAAAAVVSACSSVQPSIGQYAVVTGQGSFSDQQVKNVVDPGQHIKVGSNDTIWYLPAQVRNYVTGPGGDRAQPTPEFTGTGSGQSAMPVKVYTYVAWQLNPNHAALRSFFPFCLKYGCASQHAQTTSDNSGMAHSSTPGWNSMLAEVFPRALDNATQDALSAYGPELWTQHGEWAKLGDAIAGFFPQELHKMTGTGVNYFCGPGSTTSRCAPFTILVNKVTPADGQVAASYNQGVNAQYQQQAAQARMQAAQVLYGPDRYYFQGLKDLVDECAQQRVNCNIYVGNPPSHP